MLNSDTTAKALVMYMNSRTSRLDLTSHDVVATATDGEFALGAGRAFSQEDKESLIDILLNVESTIDFLNPRILVKSRTHLVWFNPPQVIDVMFRDVSYKAPIPGLVYIALAGGRLRCFAYKGKGRPHQETKLYQVPLGNVYSNGSFCTGNVQTPKDHSVASIEGWENFVLRCTNTHKGGVTVIRGADTTEAIIEFYKDLSESNAKAFPAAKLVPLMNGRVHVGLLEAVCKDATQ